MKRKGRFRSAMKTYTEEGSSEIRAAIGRAVFDLLKDSAYEEIKVQEVFKRASVGKTTYYRYYGNKDGKKDAMFYYLKECYFAFCSDHPEYEDLDTRFGQFLWASQEKIDLLKREKLLDIMDRLIVFLYGPSDQCHDYYVLYIKAGMIMGFMRAALETGFRNNYDTAQEEIRESLIKMFFSPIQKYPEPTASFDMQTPDTE